MKLFDFLVGPFCSGIWQYGILPCVVFSGVWFTFQTRGMHLFKFHKILKDILSRLFVKGEKKEGSVTPFQALCIALAGTVGTGSVVGTCQALALGGPGALFWLWVAAFFGMIIKFFEVTLAILYRHRDQKGEWLGGPMYYMQRLGTGGKPLGVLYALFALLSSFGMGCLAQSNSVSEGVISAVKSFAHLSEKGEKSLALGVGLVMGAILGMALFGGAERIGKVASVLVPVMSVLFVLAAMAVILFHIDSIHSVLSLILKSAFSPKPLAGAASGFGMKKALEWGLKRSAFSNEAGLGSAAIAHATAETDDPVRQGFFGIFEVFVDTLVICSLTGFAILVSLSPEGIFSPAFSGADLIIQALGTLFGLPFSRLFIGISLALFAFSTLLGWSLYGARSARFLFGKGAQGPYLFCFVLFAVLGTLLAMEPIWAVSDLFNALMAIPNFIALFFLSGKVKGKANAFFQKKPKPPVKKI